jgi:sporulation protein YlmC with PRC-barrel domain
MEIPLNANVRCADGSYGRSTHIVIHLQSHQVTHLVVKVKGTPHADCLVPFALVAETSPDMIPLRCTREDLGRTMPFTRIEWTPNAPGSYAPLLEQCLMHMSVIRPYCRPVKDKLVPPGHLALGRCTQVATINGHVGRVQKLLIYPTDGRIMRLVIRTGRLWNQKVMIVPLWRIARIGLDIPIVETPSIVPVYL